MSATAISTYQPGRNSTASAITSVSSATQIVVSTSATGPRYEAVSNVFMALAWIITPGRPPDLSTGTSWLSPNVGSTAPMNTTLPRSLDGLTRPSRTSIADTTAGSPTRSSPAAQLRRSAWRPSVGTSRPPACNESGRSTMGPASPRDERSAATARPGTSAPRCPTTAGKLRTTPSDGSGVTSTWATTAPVPSTRASSGPASTWASRRVGSTLDGRVLICSASTGPRSLPSAEAKSALSAGSTPSPPNTTSQTAVLTPASASRRASSACTERRQGSGPTARNDLLSMPMTTVSGSRTADGRKVSAARRWKPANASTLINSAHSPVTTTATAIASMIRRSDRRRRTALDNRHWRASPSDAGGDAACGVDQ